MDMLVISDTSSVEDIKAAIVALRAKAVRYSLTDPKRAAIDVEVERLVDRVLAGR